MARIRSVHPGQWTDEDFVECSPLARLLAIALRNEADDNGVFEWKPTGLKMRLLPNDHVDVGALLDELSAHNQVAIFEESGKRYGVIRNFRRWQRPDKPKSWLPIPDNLRAYAGLVADTREPDTPSLGEESANGRDQSPNSSAEVGGRREEVSDGDDARARDAKLEVLDAIGVRDDPRWLGDGGIVEAWLNAGCDLDRDILPTIRAVMAKRGAQDPPRSLKYFDRAVMDAHATRTTPSRPGKVNGHGANRRGNGASDRDRLTAGLAAAFADVVAPRPGADRSPGPRGQAGEDAGDLEAPR